MNELVDQPHLLQDGSVERRWEGPWERPRFLTETSRRQLSATGGFSGRALNDRASGELAWRPRAIRAPPRRSVHSPTRDWFGPQTP